MLQRSPEAFRLALDLAALETIQKGILDLKRSEKLCCEFVVVNVRVHCDFLRCLREKYKLSVFDRKKYKHYYFYIVLQDYA